METLKKAFPEQGCSETHRLHAACLLGLQTAHLRHHAAHRPEHRSPTCSTTAASSASSTRSPATRSRNYSIIALGISPYITASIVVQLLQMDIVPDS
ncbi:MAG: hypothetical protein MZU97_14225 [Bacillus subtilis]|nr:hypothetical protein [Bacillus subtilis]